MNSRVLLQTITTLLFLNLRVGHELEKHCAVNKSQTTIIGNEKDSESSSNPFFEDSNSKNFYDRTTSQNTGGGSSKMYLDTDTNRDLVLKQIKLFDLFKELGIVPIQTLFSCHIEAETSSSKNGQIILNFESFNEIKTTTFIKRFYNDSFLSFRIRAYLSASQSLQVLHSKDIVHCNLTPSTVGSSEVKYFSLIFRDLVYAQDLSSDTYSGCPKVNMIAQAKDIAEQKCQEKDNIKKADIWALAMIILQIEMQSNPINNTFFFDNHIVMNAKCYSKKWTYQCDLILDTLIQKTFEEARERNKRNQRNKNLLLGLEEIVKRMLADCDKRPSADELIIAFDDLLASDNDNMNQVIKLERPVKPKYKNTGFLSAIWNCCTGRDEPTDEDPEEYKLVI